MAIRLYAYSSSEVLRYEEAQLLQLKLKPGEVLVRFHAVDITRPNWYLREAFKDLPLDW
jgi:NADPH:quinone reductase-like Zn-dependent oxidoreductase